jgi:hypothetical protein
MGFSLGGMTASAWRNARDVQIMPQIWDLKSSRAQSMSSMSIAPDDFAEARRGFSL